VLGVVVCFAFFIAAPAAAETRMSSSKYYSITDIGAHIPHAYSYSIAVNDRGDVAGEIQAGQPAPFLFRSGSVTVLRPPKGVSNAIVRGINDSDTMTVNAQDARRRPVAFVVRRNRSRFIWVRLSLGALRGADVTVESIAGNGDVDGDFTMTGPHGTTQFRSVIWRSTERGSYLPARLLPMSRGFSLSLAGGIWRQRGQTYVGGAESNGTDQFASLWSPTPTVMSIPYELPFVSGIGGSPGHVFASGTSWTPGSSQAWVGRVTFDRSNVASVQTPQMLFPVTGYDQAVGTGVAADRAGRFVVVGDVLHGDNVIRGAEWQGGNAMLVQSLIDPRSPWTITEAGGVNQKLQIAGQGQVGSRFDAVLLTPPHGG
jgi:hypothetical protein